MKRNHYLSHGWAVLAGGILLWAGCALAAWAASVSEPFIIPGNANIDIIGAPQNELTQRTTAPPAGSGFRWGGMTNGTDLIDVRSAGQIRFKSGSNIKGSYYYTIFDSTGAQPPVTAAVVNNFTSVTFTTSDADAGERIRLLVRRANGAATYPNQEWFLSDPVSVTTATTYSILATNVNWEGLSTASNAMLNPLAANDEQLITTSSAPMTWAATGVTNIDGGGFYIESGNGSDWRTRTRTTWAEQPTPVPTPQITANPSPVLFAAGTRYGVDVMHGGVSSTHSLTLGNTGGANLNVSAFAWSGVKRADFTLVSTPTLPLVIAPAGSRNLVVKFTPLETTRTLSLSATLTVASDDPATPALAIPVTGDAVPVTLSRFKVE